WISCPGNPFQELQISSTRAKRNGATSPACPRRSGVTAKEGATPLSRPDEGYPSPPLHHCAPPSTMRLGRRARARPASRDGTAAALREHHGAKRFGQWNQQVIEAGGGEV